MFRRGQYEQAINSYLHLDTITSQAMEDGTAWDTHITEYVQLYKKLPEEFGGDELKNPETLLRFEVPFNDMCDLVIKPDILDENVVWENKTGNSKDSGDYAVDFQMAMYFLGLELSGKKVDYGIYNHYNQYLPLSKDNPNRTLVWNTERERERAKNFIESLVPDIYKYFEENGVFQRVIDKEAKVAYNSK
jgi:hypothetical protein